MQCPSALRWDEAADANATARGTEGTEEPEGEAAVGCRGPRHYQGQARFTRRKRPLTEPAGPRPQAITQPPKEAAAQQPQACGLKKADLSLKDMASSTPTRSETQTRGASERSAMRSVALDVGVRQIALCEVKDGQVLERATVRSVSALEKYLGPNTPKAHVAIEACRDAWALHDRLQQWGHEVVMVDTTRVRQLGVGQHGRKTDRIDAQTLALALERGHIPKAHVRSPHRRQLRLHLSVRRALVETRAQYITTTRGLARARGEQLGSSSSQKFLQLLQQTPLEESTRGMVEPLGQVLEKLNEQIAQVEAKLLQLCEQEPAIDRLTTVPGISLITAAAFVSVIDDARRFRYAHQVESYLGLVPSENSSGGRRRVGSITKQGNSYLRALLVQASWRILRIDSEDPLAKWALHLASRRGKRVAVVALARRLAGLLWAMWRDQTVYEPGRVGMQSARGLERQAQSVELQAEAMARAARKVRHKYGPVPAE